MPFPGRQEVGWEETSAVTAPAALVREYLHRVVNRHELGAVDDFVSAEYRGSGHGWPSDLTALQEFYRWQVATRPDWLIEVQETVEVGGCVVVRAYAGGAIADLEQERPLAAPTHRAVEWLAMYRVEDERIMEIQVLALRDRPAP